MLPCWFLILSFHHLLEAFSLLAYVGTSTYAVRFDHFIQGFRIPLTYAGQGCLGDEVHGGRTYHHHEPPQGTDHGKFKGWISRAHMSLF